MSQYEILRPQAVPSSPDTPVSQTIYDRMIEGFDTHNYGEVGGLLRASSRIAAGAVLTNRLEPIADVINGLAYVQRNLMHKTESDPRAELIFFEGRLNGMLDILEAAGDMALSQRVIDRVNKEPLMRRTLGIMVGNTETVDGKIIHKDIVLTNLCGEYGIPSAELERILPEMERSDLIRAAYSGDNVLLTLGLKGEGTYAALTPLEQSK